jgi:hypothetical protein
MFFFNCICRLGALQSFLSILYMVYVIWEGLTSIRPAISVFNTRSSLEFIHTCPPFDHRYETVPVIFLNF